MFYFFRKLKDLKNEESRYQKMMIHLLKKDPDFSNDCYTEWEYNCNQYKVIAFDS